MDIADPDNAAIIHCFFSYIVTNPDDVLGDEPLFEGGYHFPVRSLHQTIFLRTHSATARRCK